MLLSITCALPAYSPIKQCIQRVAQGHIWLQYGLVPCKSVSTSICSCAACSILLRSQTPFSPLPHPSPLSPTLPPPFPLPPPSPPATSTLLALPNKPSAGLFEKLSRPGPPGGPETTAYRLHLDLHRKLCMSLVVPSPLHSAVWCMQTRYRVFDLLTRSQCTGLKPMQSASDILSSQLGSLSKAVKPHSICFSAAMLQCSNASVSVLQVHKAKLKFSGTIVAVKVQYPNSLEVMLQASSFACYLHFPHVHLLTSMDFSLIDGAYTCLRLMAYC